MPDGGYVLWGHGSIGNIYLFRSGGGTNNDNNDSYALRPMVTISKNITIFGGDGSEEHPYKLANLGT